MRKGYPNLPTPFVDEERRITLPWAKLLQSLWQREANAPSAQVQALGTLPLVFTPQVSGTLAASSGSLALSRGSSGWVPLGSAATGGSVRLLIGDSAMVSWTGAPPSVVFFPDDTT